MNIEAKYIFGGAIMGISATLGMDLWNLFLKRTFGIASLNYCLLGRWVCHMTRGLFVHESILTASKKPHECVVGWISHYAIGVVFAIVFLALASDNWLLRPTLLPALLYGIGTVVFPYFILQPALGFGVASSKTPKPVQARLKSFITHTVFGFGLYMCAVVMSSMLWVHA